MNVTFSSAGHNGQRQHAPSYQSSAMSGATFGNPPSASDTGMVGQLLPVDFSQDAELSRFGTSFLTENRTDYGLAFGCPLVAINGHRVGDIRFDEPVDLEWGGDDNREVVESSGGIKDEDFS